MEILILCRAVPYEIPILEFQMIVFFIITQAVDFLLKPLGVLKSTSQLIVSLICMLKCLHNIIARIVTLCLQGRN